MLYDYELSTRSDSYYDITPKVREAISQSGVTSGIAVIYCPHTTAGITINENADPDVMRDLMLGLNNVFNDCASFRHSEGNSPAHIKASLLGSSATVIVEGGRPLLGTWQCVYFCEMDYSRRRKVYVKIIEG